MSGSIATYFPFEGFSGTDTFTYAAWDVSSQRLLLSGSGLSQRFPRGVAVSLRVVNPDGQSASTTFTRQ